MPDDLAAAIVALIDKVGSIEVGVGDLPIGTNAVLVTSGDLVGVILDRRGTVLEWSAAVVELAEPLLV